MRVVQVKSLSDVALGGGCFVPARWGFPASRKPALAVGLVDPDRADAGPNDGRPFAVADQPFEVAD